MQFLRHKLGEFLIFLIIFTPTVLIYTLLLYLGHASNEPSTFRISLFVVGIVLMLIVGFVSGNLEQKRGWIAGMTSALLIIIIFSVINNVFRGVPFKFETCIKYLAYLAAGALGGMIGVNIKSLFKR